MIYLSQKRLYGKDMAALHYSSIILNKFVYGWLPWITRNIYMHIVHMGEGGKCRLL